MPLFLKISGFLTVTAAAAAIGWMQAARLQNRLKKLTRILWSLSDLKERIRRRGGELDRLLTESFDADLLCRQNGSFQINEAGLLPADTELLRTFFADIGMSDAETEANRTALTITLLDRRRAEAEQACRERCRLYRTLGLLCGIFICIFLM